MKQTESPRIRALILILVVLAIVAIMAAMLLPALAKAKSRAQRFNFRMELLESDNAHLAVSPEFNTETYDRITDNPFLAADQNPLSTFSIDVDTASYSNIRRFITEKALPPRDAVRIEEMLNYFSYDYPQPTGDEPFAA